MDAETLNYLSAVSSIATAIATLFAALSFVYALTSVSNQRTKEKADQTRTSLYELGTESYILNWSLINDSAITIGAAEVRYELERRLGEDATAQTFTAALEDRLFIESIVAVGWYNSNIRHRLEDSMNKLQQFQVILGGKFILLDEAIEIIDASVRVNFLRDILFIASLRDSAKVYSYIKDIDSAKHGLKLFEEFLNISQNKDESNKIIRAGKFASELSKAISRIDDKTLFSLFKPQRTHKQPNRVSKLSAAIGHMEKIFPKESFSELYESAQALIQLLTVDDDSSFIDFLERLKSQGIDDPDIDLFLSVFRDDTKSLEAALRRGGNPLITQGEILDRYRTSV